MRTHDGRINHLQCRVGQAAAGERLQHHIPDATVSPAAELPKNRIPVAELLRQIAPRRAGPHQPKRRVHHTAMVARRTASATDQKRFEIRPLIIGQQSANQGCPPQRAALNQFSIPASIDLSTRPRPGEPRFVRCRPSSVSRSSKPAVAVLVLLAGAAGAGLVAANLAPA